MTDGDPSVSFTSTASGTPTPSVQWQVDTGSGFGNLANGGNVSGADTTTLTISNPTVAMSGYQYRAVFTNECGGTQIVNSDAATLTVDKATLSVNAVANGKTYGASDPGLSYTLSGFQFGENEATAGVTGTGSCTRAPGETVAGSPYLITCTAGTLAAANYTFATGATANWLGLANELRLAQIGGGVSACAVCDGALPIFRGQPLAVV